MCAQQLGDPVSALQVCVSSAPWMSSPLDPEPSECPLWAVPGGVGSGRALQALSGWSLEWTWVSQPLEPPAVQPPAPLLSGSVQEWEVGWPWAVEARCRPNPGAPRVSVGAVLCPLWARPSPPSSTMHRRPHRSPPARFAAARPGSQDWAQVCRSALLGAGASVGPRPCSVPRARLSRLRKENTCRPGAELSVSSGS